MSHLEIGLLAVESDAMNGVLFRRGVIAGSREKYFRANVLNPVFGSGSWLI